MRSKAVMAFGVGVGLCVLPIPGAVGDDTGIASMHDWQKVGRKTCLKEHFHSGHGEGRTKAKAKRAAIVDWENFTAFEYGSDWARYRLAASRGVQYQKGGEGWTASVEGRPCKRRR